jgi:hypothetical protein
MKINTCSVSVKTDGRSFFLSAESPAFNWMRPRFQLGPPPLFNAESPR